MKQGFWNLPHLSPDARFNRFDEGSQLGRGCAGANLDVLIRIHTVRARPGHRAQDFIVRHEGDTQAGAVGGGVVPFSTGSARLRISMTCVSENSRGPRLVSTVRRESVKSASVPCTLAPVRSVTTTRCPAWI